MLRDLVHRASVESSNAGPWTGQIWPLVATAALSLAVFWIIQTVAVPRVEVRKRKEDRWERHALELGRLLAFDFAAASSALERELRWRVALAERLAESASTPHLETQQAHRAAFATALREYRDIHQQIDWLLDRVMSIDPHSTRMRRLSVQEMGLIVYGLDNLAYREDSELNSELLDEASDKHREVVNEFLAAVKALLDGDPPRQPSWLGDHVVRVRARVTRAVRRLRKS